MNGRSPLRVAIVGAGLMGRWHAHAASRGAVRIAAVVDRDPSAAAALAARHRDARPFTRLADALDVVDVLHVCTPTATHVPIAYEALDAGKHLIIEKPLATSVSETEQLLNKADARHVLICPVHQFIFQKGVSQAIEAQNYIGALRHIDMSICSAGAVDTNDEGRDRLVLEILPHLFAVVARLIPGPLATVPWSVVRPAAGELRVLAQTEGVTVSMLISTAGRPTQNRMRLIGSGATMYVDMFHGFATVRDGRASRFRKITEPFTASAATFSAAALNLAGRAWSREPAYPGLTKLVTLFHRAIITAGPCPISSAEIMDVARVCEGLANALERPSHWMSSHMGHASAGSGFN